MKKTCLILFSLSLITVIGMNWSVLAKKETSIMPKETLVTPYLQTKFTSGKNLLYCGSFQLAWNELQNTIIKEPIKLNGAFELTKTLNKQSFTKENLDSNSYIAMADYLTVDFLQKLNENLKNKFGKDAPIIKEAPDKNLIMSYAFLAKKLDFMTPFEDLSEKLNFSSNNKKTPVKAFGVSKYNYKLQAMGKQVRILSYKDPNDFILSLTTKSTHEKLILAKIKPGSTLEQTLAMVEARSKKNYDSSNLNDDETVQIPKLNFLIDHSYQELEGKAFLNKGWKGWSIFKAKQWIKFQLNEKGAAVKSEGKIIMIKGTMNQPRSFIFDQPFLIYLKEEGKKPYFALWVDNAELLVK